MSYILNGKVRYYLKTSGRSPVEEFLSECSEELNKNYVDALVQLAHGESLGMPLSRNLSNIHPGLHELRLKDRNGQVRVFYYVKKRECLYLLHAFRKKTQELPKHEIDVILKRIKEV